jgi:hypothetical protein
LSQPSAEMIYRPLCSGGLVNSPIIITGTPRAGAWAVAGVIISCGAFGGDVDRGGQETITPCLENRIIREMVEGAFLHGLGVDQRGINTTPDVGLLSAMSVRIGPEWRKRVDSVYNNQGAEGRDVFIASSTAALLWPIWKSAYPEARWVFALRSEDDTVRACQKTGYMSKYKPESGWHWLYQKYYAQLSDMKSSGLDVSVVWPCKILSGDLSEIKSCVEKLGLPWNEEEVGKYLGPIHWRFGVYR